MAQSKLLRIDNVAIIVEDLQAAIAFFAELGMELQGETTVEGEWVDKVVGLKDTKSHIAMMQTPDASCKLELTQFENPKATGTETTLPLNTVGKHRVMFAVTDIDEVVGRLQKHGAEVVDEIVNYENIYRLCYLRGPAGIVIALAEQLTRTTIADKLSAT